MHGVEQPQRGSAADLGGGNGMKLAAIVKAQSMDERGRAGEIWLRGNLRPVVWLAAVAAAFDFAVFAALVVWAPASTTILLAASLCGIVGGVVTALAAVAARPRLQRVEDCLRVRLSPTAVEDVPLDAVECFFQGSNPIARSGEPTCADHAAFRVNTLVMRLAERATDFSKRTTFTPWGTWDEGYVVFDGRWCEPLSPELAREIGRRLVEAKRSLTASRSAEGQPAAGGDP